MTILLNLFILVAPMYTDAELKEEILKNNKDAIECFYNKYRKRVYFAALSSLSSEEEAEDFTHDFLIDFLFSKEGKESGIAGFIPGSRKLDKYIRVRIKWRLVDKWRGTERRPDRYTLAANGFLGGPESEEFTDMRSAIQDEISTSKSSDPSENIESEELGDIIRDAVKKLGMECQKILRYYHFSGLSQPETARKLNIAEGTARSRIHRCTEKLREFLRREFSKLGYEPF